MSIEQVIQELYGENIACGLETYLGNELTAWFVDAHNHRVEKHFPLDDFATIAAWLRAEAALRADTQAHRTSSVESLLGDLANAARKPPVRVSADARQARLNSTDERLHGTDDSR